MSAAAAEFVLDFGRRERIGLDEAVFSAGKSPSQINAILAEAAARGASMLLTRLDPAKFAVLDAGLRDRLDYCPVSETAVFGGQPEATFKGRVAVVCAGTSDLPLATDPVRLVPGVVIAVPTSVGYGVAAGGRAALDAILSSCAPGITVVNIDNGYGAACAALRLLGAAHRITEMT